MDKALLEKFYEALSYNRDLEAPVIDKILLARNVKPIRVVAVWKSKVGWIPIEGAEECFSQKSVS
jgi:hypothetical protein